MDFFNPIFLQIFLDLILLAAIIVLLWRINTNLKNPPLDSLRTMTAEFQTLIIESQANADKFLQAMEQSRLVLKELALELELKEKRVRTILEKAQLETEKKLDNESVSQHKYSDVINMIKNGHSEEETANQTGFTQAEVGLIVDLYRIKNENI